VEIVYRTPVIVSNDDEEEIAYHRRKNMKVLRYDDIEVEDGGA